MGKIKVTDNQGRPHTLTQTNGNTFRLYARQSRVIEDSLVSDEFYAEQKKGNLLITSVKNEGTKYSKGGHKK